MSFAKRDYNNSLGGDWSRINVAGCMEGWVDGWMEISGERDVLQSELLTLGCILGIYKASENSTHCVLLALCIKSTV